MPTMTRVFQMRRGLLADLPVLAVGEPGLATDTKQLFIGTASGNKEIDNIYTPSNPAHWSGTPPADFLSAIQRLEAAVFLLAGSIP